jgi:hypothetical protein
MHVSVRISKAYADELRESDTPMLHMTEVDIVNTEMEMETLA